MSMSLVLWPPINLCLNILDDVDQEPVPLFGGELGSQICPELLLRRRVVNAHVQLPDDLVGAKIPRSNIFGTRAVSLVSGYM